jgi:hypothetical protein
VSVAQIQLLAQLAIRPLLSRQPKLVSVLQIKLLLMVDVSLLQFAQQASTMMVQTNVFPVRQTVQLATTPATAPHARLRL